MDELKAGLTKKKYKAKMDLKLSIPTKKYGKFLVS